MCEYIADGKKQTNETVVRKQRCLVKGTYKELIKAEINLTKKETSNV